MGNSRTFNGYDDLEAFLRGFANFSDTPAHDLIGALHLFAALLDNLRRNIAEEDFAEIRTLFSLEQAAFLRRLADNTIEGE